MQLTVVPHEETIFTIQKCCLSQWTVFGENHPQPRIKDGRFALVQISDKAFCVCKLFFQREVHPSFVYLDSSVVHFKSEESSAFPKFPLNTCDGFVHDNNIQVLPQVVVLRKVSLSVIVENVSDIPVWKRDSEKLKSVVLELLKLYVVTKDSVISLRNLKDGLRHSIHGFVIHSSSNFSDSIVAGQVTSQSDVSIVRITSKLRFEQCMEQRSVPKMGGLETPANFLKDVIRTNTNYRNASKKYPLKPTRQVSS